MTLSDLLHACQSIPRSTLQEAVINLLRLSIVPRGLAKDFNIANPPPITKIEVDAAIVLPKVQTKTERQNNKWF